MLGHLSSARCHSQSCLSVVCHLPSVIGAGGLLLFYRVYLTLSLRGSSGLEDYQCAPKFIRRYHCLCQRKAAEGGQLRGRARGLLQKPGLAPGEAGWRNFDLHCPPHFDVRNFFSRRARAIQIADLDSS
jgi:hypothetical protein